jgi:hypothetical protein
MTSSKLSLAQSRAQRLHEPRAIEIWRGGRGDQAFVTVLTVSFCS